MAVQFKVPKAPERTIETIDIFHGADFTNSPVNITMDKSPNCQNMIRSTPGKVRKSMGWEVCCTVSGENQAVNGFFTFKDYKIWHIKSTLYIGQIVSDVLTLTEITNAGTALNNHRSRAWEQSDRLYILDGNKIHVLTLEGTPLAPKLYDLDSSSIAYIPTVTISKDPNGGGTPYEDLNLLQPGFTEQFLGQASVTEYQLSFTNLDNTTVTAAVLNAQGQWVAKAESTDFTVNRSTGVITFSTAPGASPISGEDNVKITAYRTVSGYADRINKCDIGITYGGIGGKERLFVSGNSGYLNYDWCSDPYDFSYFRDTSYSRLGNDGSAIMGYAIVSNKLVTFKDENDREQNAIVRTASKDSDNKEIFVITNALQGIGVIAKDSFGYLAHEPLFLTSQGIYSITTQDVTGERYMQLRSFFLNGKLLDESNLKDSVAFCYNNFYILALNNVFYILDGLQSLQTDKSAPYSTRQYAGFYRINVPANILWEDDDALWFGTSDGKICKFYTDESDTLSYSDNGDPIVAMWETPDIDGKLFYKNKTLRYLALRVDAAIRTSVKIYAMERGLWSLIKEDAVFAMYLVFSRIQFSRFTFSCDKTQRVTRTKARLKKVDKFRLRIVNDALNEPFSLFNIGFEYVEKGNFKG